MTARRRSLAALPAVLALVGIGALLVLFALRAFHERGLAVDDAYILTRYASHLADGHGFRWNVTSAPVEGFTSPLFVVLLAGLLRMGLEPTAASTLLNVAAIAGVVAILIGVANPRRPGFIIALVPTVLLLLDPAIVVHASRGLETSVFFLVAVTLVSVAGGVVRRPGRLAGIGMAALSLLLVWARPDGALIVGVCWTATALALRLHTGRMAVLLPGAAGLIAAGTAYVAWKLWYFGELLPTAYHVKATGLGWPGSHNVSLFAGDYWGWLIGAAAACVGAGALAIGGAPGRWRHMHLESVIPAVVSIPWLIYSAKIVHEMGYEHRFVFVLVPLAAFAVTHGLRVALDLAVERGIARRALVVGVSGVAAVGIALMSVGPVSGSLDVLRRPAPEDPFVTVFARLGRAIASAGLGEQISYVDGSAGAAPYFAGARHLDPFGLASREFSKVVPFERRRQLWLDSAFDVVKLPYLPASPGATNEADEPLRGTEYWQYIEQIGRFQQQFGLVTTGMDEWLTMSHWMMRYLRDHMTLVGAAAVPEGRMIVYVSNSSPHYAHLVATLSRALDIPAAQVR